MLDFVAIARPGTLASEALCEPSRNKMFHSKSLESATDISKSFLVIIRLSVNQLIFVL